MVATTLWNNLSFSLNAVLFVCYIVAISDKRKKFEMKVSTDWCVTVKCQRLSLIRVIFINYQTSKLLITSLIYKNIL